MAFNRKQRLRDNIEAIQTAFVLDREQTTATAEERATLQKYCGFGGLKCILNPARELTDAVHWAKSDLELFPMTVELHRLIRENSRDDIEYKRFVDSLKASVLTAFYTPKEITDTIADVLHEHGIHPDRVLEPSAGVGAFVDAVLKNKPDADVMAFEKDLMTGKILKHLHSDQKVRIQGFEKIEAPFMKYFDLAISNIPFGDIAVFDPVFQNSKSFGRRSSQQAIHNYFFLKGLDAVRNGGIVAFITSQGVLNSTKVSVRNEMFRQADLVSAIRLPNNLFSDNAGTEVSSDLIILQKNQHKTELTQDEQLMTGIQTDMKTDLMDNAYFIRHPERIVHTFAKLDTDPYGKPAMVYLHEGKTAGIAGDLRRMLAEDCRSRLVMRSYSEAIQQPGVRVNVSTQTERPDVKLETVPPVHTAEIQDRKSQPMDYSEGVQLSLFTLWGMTEEVRKQETSSKKTAKPESKARRMPPKPQVQVTPKVATVTSETSIASTPKNRAEKGNPEVVYAAIDWDSNPPVNGFYETMINLTPERRMELRQRALRYQQEHLQKGSDKDISEAVIVPSSDNRQIRSTATEEKMGESGSVSKITTESVTATSGKIPTSLFPDLEIENQEAKVPDLSPRPFDGLLEPHHRDGSMVLDAFRNLGYLKDLTPYGATFQPLDLTGYQKEKALLYISLRDAYERLYSYEAENHEENKPQRGYLNTHYDEFVMRYGPLNARQNVSMLLMDAAGRDILSLERAEGGKFIKADIFARPVSFSVETCVQVGSPDEALAASLNKYGTVNLDYMREITDSTEEELLTALQGRIYYNPLAAGYEIKDRFIAGNVIEKAEGIATWINENPDNEHIPEVKQALDALKEAEPPRITFEELDFNFGERWIPTGIYSAYMTRLYGTDIKIAYNENIDEFSIGCQNRENLKIKNEFAVDGYYKSYDGIALLKHALVNTCPDMMKSIGKDENGNDIKVRDSEKIQLANAKIDEIRNGFSEWLEEQSPEFKERLVTLYNRKFNCFVRPQYDGSHQTFPDLNLKGLASRGIKDIYPSQKDCVWMLKQNGGGVCDHEVVRP